MALARTDISMVLVFASMLWLGAKAQSDCTSTLMSLSPCLNYITGNSSTPSSGCCSQLTTVVSSQPQCLCQVLNGGGSSLGLNINQTQAMALPGACNVQTPPASRCGGGSSADSPAGTPETPSTGRGSKTVPSTGNDGSTSDAGSNKSLIPLLSLVFAAFCASSFMMH